MSRPGTGRTQTRELALALGHLRAAQKLVGFSRNLHRNAPGRDLRLLALLQALARCERALNAERNDVIAEGRTEVRARRAA